MEKVLAQVLDKIKPSKKEESETKVNINNFVSKLNSKLKDAKAVVGGSQAKKTWLSENNEVDVFVQFDYKKFSKNHHEISDLLEKKLKKISKKITRLHGSRDYFQIKEGKITFEVVPILKIKKAEQAKNITDISMLHVNWVLKKIKSTPLLADEIRLTKMFFIANRIYGAESYISGFSGYLTEILTIYYGSFKNLIKNAKKWGTSKIIDIEKHHKNPQFEINASKRQGPLIVIDPVQASRNVAAALSFENYNKLIKYSNEFSEKKSEELFEMRDIKSDLLKQKKKNNLIEVMILPKSGKKDIIGAKLIKVFEYIKRKLIENDFEIIDSDWVFEKKAVFYFLTKAKKLEKTVTIKGPLLKMKKHVIKFKKIHKKTITKNKRIFAIEKRKFLDEISLIKSLKKDNYILERVKEIEKCSFL